jgi:hypothetical protein
VGGPSGACALVERHGKDPHARVREQGGEAQANDNAARNAAHDNGFPEQFLLMSREIR